MSQPRIELPAMDAELPTSDRPDTEDESLTSEMLVEEVSIDGMCGVY